MSGEKLNETKVGHGHENPFIKLAVGLSLEQDKRIASQILSVYTSNSTHTTHFLINTLFKILKFTAICPQKNTQWPFPLGML